MDLAGGHVNALDAVDDDSKFAGNTSPGKFKAYNLGKGVGMSVLNMIEAMKKVTGYGYPYKIVGRRQGDVPDLTADPSMAERELGFKATHTLEDMVRVQMCEESRTGVLTKFLFFVDSLQSRDLWNWQQNNPEGYNTKH